MSSSLAPVVVWGNCQADPIASLLRAPLEAVGMKVVRLPPVYLIDEIGLKHLRQEVLPKAAALISQPIRDEYRLPGCGTNQLAGRLPDAAKLITFPITYDTSAFPYQVRAHRGDGGRIDAPITDYHDLRVIVAAERGMTADQALDWWPAPTADMVVRNAARSVAELQRREQLLNVKTSDLLAGPAMFTLSHPTNLTLVEIARRIAVALGLPVDNKITNPDREFLGERQAPVETAVADALGWPQCAQRANWVVRGQELRLLEILRVQLDFYAEHADIVSDTRRRFADRLALLAL